MHGGIRRQEGPATSRSRLRHLQELWLPQEAPREVPGLSVETSSARGKMELSAKDLWGAWGLCRALGECKSASSNVGDLSTQITPEYSRRWRLQIYADVLLSIHSIRRSTDRITLFQLEGASHLTYRRLKEVLDELKRAGLVSENLALTENGYAFLSEVTGRMLPTLEKYGLLRRKP